MKENIFDKIFIVLLLGLIFCLVIPPAQAATEEEIEASIQLGIDWLVTVQNSDGSWGGSERVAHTGFAVIKLEARAFELGYSPFDPAYDYSDNVIAGLDYIFSNAHTIGISPQPSGNPDGDGDGIGVYISDSGHRTYATGIAMMAIAGSKDPSGTVTTGALSGWSYADVLQDAVDYLAFGQNDASWPRGAWGYQENYGWSDNSNSGYAVLGLDFAQSPQFGFETPVPQFVKDELNIWIDYIQNDNGLGYYDDPLGGSGYSNPEEWVNILKTGNLIYQMAFYGDDPSVQRVIDAVDYIERHWNDNNSEPGFRPHHFQSMYTMMKGFERMGIDIITVGGMDIDWFDEVSTIIVSSQNPGGSWPYDYWGDEILSAGWALLTLEKVTPSPVITVYFDIKPQSWPNPLNTNSKGVLPVAILGTADFDVTTIDPATVMLEGVSPIRWNIEDVATPDGDPEDDCNATTAGADGYDDLTLKFDKQTIVAALGPVNDGDVIVLTVTGSLFDGSQIEGRDCVIIRAMMPPLNCDLNDPAEHEYNEVRLLVGSDGRLAANDNLTAHGFFPSETCNQYIFTAGIWVGGLVNGEPIVAQAAHWSEFGPSEIGNTGEPFRVFNSKFKDDKKNWPPEFCDSDGKPVIVPSAENLVVQYNDNVGTPRWDDVGPLGIEIRQRSLAYENHNLRNSLIFIWEITNITDGSIEDVYTGFWSDSDIGVYNDDRSSTVNDMGIVWDNDFSEPGFGEQPAIMAFDFLETPNGNGVTNFVTIVPGANPDPTSDWEEYQFLSGNAHYETDDVADVRFLLSTGPFHLDPGQSVVVSGAIHFGRAPDGTTELRVDPNYPFRPDPNDIVLANLLNIQGEVQQFYDQQLSGLSLPKLNELAEKTEIGSIPKEYGLSQNYPNPFNPTTTISYTLPKDSRVVLKIYNTIGQEITTLVKDQRPAGEHQVQWQPQDLPSGVYIISFTAGDYHQIRKMLYVK